MSSKKKEPKKEAQKEVEVPAEDAKKETEKENVRELPPRLKYLPKPRKIYIPFVVPWESQGALQNQAGMGAFGKGRDPVSRIDTGSKTLKQGELNTETILTCFAETNKYASQKDMKSFGGHRRNVTKFTSSKELDKDQLQASEGIIPLQSGCRDLPTQAGETPIGSLRKQVPRIKYSNRMSGTSDPTSDTFVGRLMTPNPNNKAGTTVIDTKRQNVMSTTRKHLPETEGIVPKLMDTSGLCDPSGTGAGHFGLRPPRQVTTVVNDGSAAEILFDDVIKSKKEVPWSSRAQLESQAGMGGFNRTRDVVNHVKYRF